MDSMASDDISGTRPTLLTPTEKFSKNQKTVQYSEKFFHFGKFVHYTEQFGFSGQASCAYAIMTKGAIM